MRDNYEAENYDYDEERYETEDYNQEEYDEDEYKEPTPSWKGTVIFGIVNIVCVLLATMTRTVFFSSFLVILLMFGVMFSAKCIVDDWKEGFKTSAFLCGYVVAQSVFVSDKTSLKDGISNSNV